MQDGMESPNMKNEDVESEEMVPQGDAISAEAIVNMLVKKGICSVEEIFMLEGRIRDKNEDFKRENYTQVKEMSQVQSNKQSHSKMKKLFGKYHWTRKVGHSLFGWKWKKVKRSSSLDSIQNDLQP